jgi:hypothetical protein
MLQTRIAKNSSMGALAMSCESFERWRAKTDAVHLRECQDPDCAAAVCRAARGLPPLDPETLWAEARQRREEQRRKAEKFREGIRRVAQSNGKPRGSK